jgi:hypothetical protein
MSDFRPRDPIQRAEGFPDVPSNLATKEITNAATATETAPIFAILI